MAGESEIPSVQVTAVLTAESSSEPGAYGLQLSSRTAAAGDGRSACLQVALDLPLDLLIGQQPADQRRPHVGQLHVVFERPAAQLAVHVEPSSRQVKLRDEAGKPVLDEAGEPITVTEEFGGTVRGWDLMTAAPKSVSMLWGLGDDGTRAVIEAAHQAASEDALAYRACRVHPAAGSRVTTRR